MREDIIDLFKKGLFLFKGNIFKTNKEKSEETIEMSVNDGIVFVKEKSRDINNDLLRHILIFQHLLIWQKNYSKQKIKRKTVKL